MPKNSWDGVSALKHCWRTLRGGVYAADNRCGTIFLGVSAGDSSVSGVQDGVGGVVAESTLLVPEWEEATPSMGNTTGNTIPQTI